MDYINTSHPNFIGGNKSVEVAHQQVKASRLSTLTSKSKEGVDTDKVPTSEKSLKSRGILARPGINGIATDQGVRPTADSERPGSTGNSVSSWGIPSIFGASESRASVREISPNKSNNVPVRNMDHSLSTIQLREPPIILKPSEYRTEQEDLEIAITKLLLRSYYDIVRKNVEDSVPKAVMHFLVNHTKRELHNVFIRKLYRENLFEEMLREPDDIVAKRKRIRETLRLLQQAYRTLDELPLDAESVEKGFNLDADATGLPRAHGLPASFYGTGSDFGSPLYMASPKNPKPRRSAHSGEQPSPMHGNSDSNGGGY